MQNMHSDIGQDWQKLAVEPGLEFHPETVFYDPQFSAVDPEAIQAEKAAARAQEDRDDLGREQQGVNGNRINRFTASEDNNAIAARQNARSGMDMMMGELNRQQTYRNHMSDADYNRYIAQPHDDMMHEASAMEAALQTLFQEAIAQSEVARAAYQAAQDNAMQLDDGSRAYLRQDGVFVDDDGVPIEAEAQSEAAVRHDEREGFTTAEELDQSKNMFSSSIERAALLESSIDEIRSIQERAAETRLQFDNEDISQAEFDERMQLHTSDIDAVYAPFSESDRQFIAQEAEGEQASMLEDGNLITNKAEVEVDVEVDATVYEFDFSAMGIDIEPAESRLSYAQSMDGSGFENASNLTAAFSTSVIADSTVPTQANDLSNNNDNVDNDNRGNQPPPSTLTL
jgi:hypothetical protein